MNCQSHLVIVATVLSLLFGIDSASAQRRTMPGIKPRDARLTPGTGELKKQGTIFTADVDLGRLDVGRTYDIQLTFKNPYDKEIRFYDVSKKCSCSSFRPGKYVVPANGERALKVSIKTPPRSRTGSESTPIEFVYEGNVVIRAKINFELDGVLAFGKPMGFVNFNAEDSQKEITVPIVTTGKVGLDNVVIESSDNLKEAKFELVAGQKGAVLKGTIPDSVLTAATVRGEVYISSPDAKGKDGYMLVIKDKAKNEISPRIMTFRKKDDQMVSTAIVQIAGRSESLPDNPIVCRYRGQLIDSEVKTLKKNTFKVQLTLTEQLMAAMSDAGGKEAEENSKPGQLEWSIDNGTKVSKKETAFVIDQN